MLQIALVDDEEVFILHFKMMISKLFENRQINIKITSYLNGSDLIKSQELEKFDLIFLDIDLPDVSGMQVAADLRNRLVNTTLIFVSGHSNFVFESIQYTPFRFIRKTELEIDTSEAINAFCDKKSLEIHKIPMHLHETGKNVVDLRQIMYFYSLRHEIYYVTCTKSSVRLAPRAYTMDSIEQLLEKHGFIRTHKSYIVNYLYIYKIHSEKIVLKDQTTVNISRVRVFEVKNKYQYLLRKDDSL